MTLHAEDTLLPVLLWAVGFNVAVAVMRPSGRWGYIFVVGVYVMGAAIIRGMS